MNERIRGKPALNATDEQVRQFARNNHLNPDAYLRGWKQVRLNKAVRLMHQLRLD